MFWKIVNEKPLSLVNKMILLYSVTTMFIVVFVCIILFPSFEKITHVYNTSYKDHVFSQCMISLYAALILSFISTLFFSTIIAKKSTKQIDLLAEKIKYTNINSLSEKINLNYLPKELKPIGESFNAMVDKIKNSFDHMSQFSSDIAHELRNPIHNLLGMNEIALSYPCEHEKHHTTLESNLEECRYLLNMIESLWFISSSDHDYLLINKSVFNISKEILHVLDYYESYASESNVQISYVGEALLSADIILFKRAISNILSNALKYTPRFGKINIQVEKSEKYISISLEDSGLGIAEKHLPKLCDRFYRVDSSRSSQTGGLGLGLAIVKSIMDLHQGKISIQSKLHIGTTVFLYFPV